MEKEGAAQLPRQAESEEVSWKFDGLLSGKIWQQTVCTVELYTNNRPQNPARYLSGGLQTKPDTYQAV